MLSGIGEAITARDLLRSDKVKERMVLLAKVVSHQRLVLAATLAVCDGEPQPEKRMLLDAGYLGS